MKKEFETLRPDNIPKNYWYGLRKKLFSNIPEDAKLDLSNVPDDDEFCKLQILSILADKMPNIPIDE
jgi:hypothetical protein